MKKERKKTVFYQWLKDETELEGKRHFSLVLDSVKMIDFGSYKCRVKYEHGESEESSAAELDVKPGAGKGKCALISAKNCVLLFQRHKHLCEFYYRLPLRVMFLALLNRQFQIF